MKKTLLLLAILTALFSCKKEASLLELLTIYEEDTIYCRVGVNDTLLCGSSPYNGVDPDLHWESSDESVATAHKYDRQYGIITPIKQGMVTITLWVDDGTGLSSSVTLYVLDKPKISIKEVSNLTFYSANIDVQYDLCGGENINSSIGFVWDTLSAPDRKSHLGIFEPGYISDEYYIDRFESGKKLYLRAYAANPLDTAYSDDFTVIIQSVPDDLMVNYMLNSPLALGKVVKHDGWIYYNNFAEEEKLFRIKENLTNKEVLSYDITDPRGINIIGSTIYLSGHTPPHTYFKIMSIKLDGSDFRYLRDKNNYKCTSWGPIITHGKYIYPSYGYFRISHKENEFLPNIANNHYTNIANNKLYFCSMEVDNVDSLYTINSCNLNGSEMKELYRGYNDHMHYDSFLGIYENAAYFLEKDVFKKFDLSSPDIVEILPIKPQCYNIDNYTIFFANSEDNNKLYKCDLAGNLVEKLSDDSVSVISVIDDWLYYYCRTDNYLYRIKQDGTDRQVVD